MNYLKELKAFRDWLLLNDLPTSAIALWHTLMTINNMAGWKERFNAPNSTVEKLTGLSKQGLVDARRKLIENGLIEYEKGKKGKAPIYKIVSLVNSLDQYPYQSGDQSQYQYQYQSSDKSCNIPKHKQNNTETKTIPPAADRRVNYFDTYMLCFGGQPSAMQIQEINYLIDIKGLTEEVVCIAFKKAAEVGAKYSYARTILNRWADAGIKTASDVEREQKEFEQRQQNKPKQYRRGKPGRVEKLPDWFKKEPEDHTPEITSSEDGETLEEKRRRLEKIRASYKKAGS
ncbi:DnaD domain protein [Weizmannia sp. FSL K6-0777]|uniref:DnaD domain protein n=1 Tax=Weizmannia sp. FSL K6-0777 TaxID=2954674 RepID=UPI0031592647